MQYFGGKQRISKELSTFLNGELKENQPFVDMFCGSCNVVTKINPKRLRVANDKHTPLISMWKYLQTGGKLPDVVTEEDYYGIKADGPDHLTGFVGFGLSFAGKWWGGYARSGNRDYLQNAKNSLNKKLVHLQDVCFLNYDYKDCPLPDGCLVYCDIPYKIQHLIVDNKLVSLNMTNSTVGARAWRIKVFLSMLASTT